jgi:hypothetical protein
LAKSSEVLGGVAPLAAGMVLGASTGLPEAMIGATLMGAQGSGQGLYKGYVEAKNKGMSDKDAIAYAKDIALKEGGTQAVIGALMPGVSGKLESLVLPETEYAALKQFLLSGAGTSSIFGAGQVVQNLLEGKDPTTDVEKAVYSGAFLHVLTGMVSSGLKLPKNIKDIYDVAIARRLPEIEQPINDGIKAGTIDYAQGMKVLNDAKQTSEIIKKLPPDWTAEELMVAKPYQEKIDQLHTSLKLANSEAVKTDIQNKIDQAGQDMIQAVGQHRTERESLKVEKGKTLLKDDELLSAYVDSEPTLSKEREDIAGMKDDELRKQRLESFKEKAADLMPEKFVDDFTEKKDAEEEKAAEKVKERAETPAQEASEPVQEKSEEPRKSETEKTDNPVKQEIKPAEEPYSPARVKEIKSKLKRATKKYEDTNAALEKNGGQAQIDIFGNREGDKQLFDDNLSEQRKIVEGHRKKMVELQTEIDRMESKKPDEQLPGQQEIFNGGKEQKESNKQLTAAEPDTPRQMILQYFASGGRIHTDSMRSETGFGAADRDGAMRAREELNKRIWAHSKDAPVMDDLVQQFKRHWESEHGGQLDDQEIRAEINDVLTGHEGKSSMLSELQKDFEHENGSIMNTRQERADYQFEKYAAKYIPEEFMKEAEAEYAKADEAIQKQMESADNDWWDSLSEEEKNSIFDDYERAKSQEVLGSSVAGAEKSNSEKSSGQGTQNENSETKSETDGQKQTGEVDTGKGRSKSETNSEEPDIKKTDITREKVSEALEELTRSLGGILDISAEKKPEVIAALYKAAKAIVEHTGATIEEAISTVLQKLKDKYGDKITEDEIKGLDSDLRSEFRDDEDTRKTGARKELTEKELDDLGLDPVEKDAVRRRPDTFAKAKHDVEIGDFNVGKFIGDRIGEINDGKQIHLTDYETDALVYHKAKLLNFSHEITKDIAEAKSKGDEAGQKEGWQKLAVINDEFSDTAKVLKRGLSTAGRTLRSAKDEIASDYTFLGQMAQIKAEHDTVSPDTEKVIFEQTTKIKELQKELDDLQKRRKAKSDGDTVEQTKKSVRGNRIRSKEDIQAERKEIVSKIKERTAALLHKAATASGAAKSLAMDDETTSDIAKEIAPLVYDLFKGYVEEALGDAKGAAAKIELPEIVEKIKNELADVKDLSERHIRDAISGYGKIKETRTKTELQSQVERLKKEAKELSIKEDVKSGDIYPPEDTRILKNIEAQIRKLQDKINAGDFSKTSSREIPEIAKSAKEALDTLRKAYKDAEYQAVKDAKIKDPRDQAAIQRMTKQIEDLAKSIEAIDKGTYVESGKKMPVVLSAEGQKIKEALDQSKEEFKNRKAAAIEAGELPDPRGKAKLTRLKNTIGKIEEKIKNGDYSKEERKPPVPLTPEMHQIQAKINAAKDKIDLERAKLDYAAKPGWQKAVDWIPRLNRFNILTSPKIIGKLIAAGAWQLSVTPLRKSIQTGLGKTVLKSVAEKAPTEGRLSVKQLAENYNQLMKKAFYKDIPNTFKEGKSEIYGFGTERKSIPTEPTHFTDYVNNSHAVAKLLPFRSEYYASRQAATEYAIRQGWDLNDLATENTIHTLALDNAERNIFKSPNAVSKKYQGMIDNLKTTGTIGYMAATALDVIFPVKTIPLNIMKDLSSYVGGGAAAYGRVKKVGGVEHLSAEDADYVMRNAGKNIVGAIGIAAAYGLASSAFGGLYHKGDVIHADDQEKESYRVTVAGKEIDVPAWALHHPVIIGTMIGADVKKQMQDGEKEMKHVDLSTAIGKSTISVLESIPFLSGPANLFEAARDKKDPAHKLNIWAAKEVRNIAEPSVVQHYAKEHDVDEFGNKIRRKEDSFTDVMKAGIPKLRQTLPESMNLYYKDKVNKNIRDFAAQNPDADQEQIINHYEENMPDKYKSGAGLTKKKVKNMADEARLGDDQIHFKRMKAAEQADMWKKLTPDQKERYKELLHKSNKGLTDED